MLRRSSGGITWPIHQVDLHGTAGGDSAAAGSSAVGMVPEDATAEVPPDVTSAPWAHRERGGGDAERGGGDPASPGLQAADAVDAGGAGRGDEGERDEGERDEGERVEVEAGEGREPAEALEHEDLQFEGSDSDSAEGRDAGEADGGDGDEAPPLCDSGWMSELLSQPWVPIGAPLGTLPPPPTPVLFTPVPPAPGVVIRQPAPLERSAPAPAPVPILSSEGLALGEKVTSNVDGGEKVAHDGGTSPPKHFYTSTPALAGATGVSGAAGAAGAVLSQSDPELADGEPILSLAATEPDARRAPLPTILPSLGATQGLMSTVKKGFRKMLRLSSGGKPSSRK